MVLFVLTVTALGVLYFFAPGAGGIYPPCPTHYLTSFSCPGCGSLRAVHNLLHGNFKEAFFFNPLTVVVLPFAAIWFLIYLSNLFLKTKIPEIKVKPAVILLVFSVIILFMVLRNLPFYPFTLFKS